MSTQDSRVRIYSGYDNELYLDFTQDGSVYDVTGLTRVRLLFGATEVDSDTSPSAFDWTTDGANGRVIFYPGSLSIPAGSYDQVKVITYDTKHPNGVVWTTSLKVDVVSI